MRQPVLFLLLLAIFILAIWPIGGYILVFCSFILALQKGEGRELGQIFVNDWALWLVTGVFWLSAILSGNLIVTFIGGLLFSLQIILYLLVRVYLTGKYCSKAIDLLILAGFIVALYGLGQYFKETKAWFGEVANGKDVRVIAWQPLPKPYKAESEG